MAKYSNGQSKGVRARTLFIARGVQILLLISGLYQLFFGEKIIGIATLMSLAMIVTPEIVVQKPLVIPIEIQILLSLMVVFQYVIGEAWGFYKNSHFPYYDKFVHLLLMLFTAVIGLMVAYSMHLSGHLISTKKVIFLVVLFFTLGIGALWEILEYASDELIYPRVERWHQSQGSQTEDAHHDTMNDLVVDLVGSATGGLLAVYYIKKAEAAEEPRFGQLMDEISVIQSRSLISKSDT